MDLPPWTYWGQEAQSLPSPTVFDAPGNPLDPNDGQDRGLPVSCEVPTEGATGGTQPQVDLLDFGRRLFGCAGDSSNEAPLSLFGTEPSHPCAPQDPDADDTRESADIIEVLGPSALLTT